MAKSQASMTNGSHLLKAKIIQIPVLSKVHQKSLITVLIVIGRMKKYFILVYIQTATMQYHIGILSQERYILIMTLIFKITVVHLTIMTIAVIIMTFTIDTLISLEDLTN